MSMEERSSPPSSKVVSIEKPVAPNGHGAILEGAAVLTPSQQVQFDALIQAEIQTYRTPEEAKTERLKKVTLLEARESAEEKYFAAKKTAALPKSVDLKNVGTNGEGLRKNETQQSYGDLKNVTPAKPEGPSNFVYEKNQKLISFQNTLIAFDNIGIKCRYDVFHNKFQVDSHLLQEESVDVVAIMIRNEIIRWYKFDPGKQNVFDALVQRSYENVFDPVKDYLAGLQWDKVPRIDRWLTTHLGAEDNPLNRAIGRKMLIAAVRRVRQPGCKFDYIIVMDNSRQGAGKSSVIQILAGEGNFSDQELLTVDSREHQEQLEGVWLYEIGELSGLHRADVNKVKSFASRQMDRARPAYGKFRVDRPRRCILIGTTNDDEYLQDPTGNRRFWPFTPGAIDVEAVRRDRDQLWAEAAVAEAAGEVLTIPEDCWAEIEARQQSRMISDPWEDVLGRKLAGLPELIRNSSPPEASVSGDKDSNLVYRISSSLLLETYLKLPPEKVFPAHLKRLAQVMRKLGWSLTDVRFGNRVVKGYAKQAIEKPVQNQ